MYNSISIITYITYDYYHICILDDEDGEWIAPVEENPLYQGPWKPRRITNPAYQGVWHPPNIPNPDYVVDPDLAVYHTAYVGFDIWQGNGSINIIICILTNSINDLFSQGWHYIQAYSNY